MSIYANYFDTSVFRVDHINIMSKYVDKIQYIQHGGTNMLTESSYA